eukprot:4249934-Pyramimonas_sp.AAC.1
MQFHLPTCLLVLGAQLDYFVTAVISAWRQVHIEGGGLIPSTWSAPGIALLARGPEVTTRRDCPMHG